jgi:hypothetical protein
VAAVKCPKCGAINPDGHRRTARCIRCHEALGKCRYCRHYDFRIGDCVNTARRSDDRVLDADEMLNCPEFSSVLTERAAGAAGWKPAPRRLWVVVAAVVLSAVAAAVVIRALGLAPEAKWASVRAGVEAPESVIQDEGLTITVAVVNEGKEAVRDLRVIVAGRSLPWLVCQYVTPEEFFLDASPKAVSAALGDLAPGEIRTVGFRFLANRAGDVQLAAHVTGANLETPTTLAIECQVLP